MEYKEFCEKLIGRLREEKGDIFQIEMRTQRMGRTEKEYLSVRKNGTRETMGLDPQYLYSMYKYLQDFNEVVDTVCSELETYEKHITFEEFTQAIYLDVSIHLPNGTCKITDMEKQNGSEKVLLVTNGRYGESYNLSALYMDYLEHGDLRAITKTIVLNQKTLGQEFPLKPEDLLDYKEWKGQIFFAVTNGVERNNEKFLQNVPNYSMLDLQVYPRIITNDYCLAVTHDLIKLWGISKDRVYKDAKANMAKACKAVPVHPSVVTVSNKYCRFGSGFLADERSLKDLHKRFGDFYIIPDNIHSSMLVPSVAVKKMKWSERDIQKKGNDFKKLDPVPEEENLSNNIYFYDNKSLTLINTMGAYIQKQRYTFSISAPKPQI